MKNERNLEVLHIRYEDLKQDPEKTIMNIAKFLGYIHFSWEDAKAIKDLTSYENMKKTHSNTVHANTEGKSGTYKSKLTDKNIQDINHRIAQFLEQHGETEVRIDKYCD